jgi:hypothetical protein
MFWYDCTRGESINDFPSPVRKKSLQFRTDGRGPVLKA